jgi:hypothetical protein
MESGVKLPCPPDGKKGAIVKKPPAGFYKNALIINMLRKWRAYGFMAPVLLYRW